jgi:2-dehydropantoate 2-reductase
VVLFFSWIPVFFVDLRVAVFAFFVVCFCLCENSAMRFVVYGAGGVGGVVGARLAQHGYDVALIARGQHYEALRADGITVESPDDTVRLKLPAFNHPSQISWSNDDVVLLTMKSQDTIGAVDALAAVAPAAVPVFCLQNGVANERIALRRFANVYGVFVYCAASYLEPGIMQAWHSPMTGILDVGRYPSGVDRTAEAVADAFRRATFYAEPRPDVMRWKYRKLLMNLGNAVEALTGPLQRGNAVVDAATREGIACLQAAGQLVATDEEEPVLREKTLPVRPINDQQRPGGSTWQSLKRHTPTTEVDYLNGEIVWLGRMHGVPTPVNDALQRLMRKAVTDGAAPASLSIDQLTKLI